LLWHCDWMKCRIDDPGGEISAKRLKKARNHAILSAVGK
jgi:hypothetical protein